MNWKTVTVEGREFHDLSRWSWGHGMPPGDTLGDQLILWGFLNVQAGTLFHPDYGVCSLKWTHGTGCPVVPDGALIVHDATGREIPHTVPAEGWYATFDGRW